MVWYTHVGCCVLGCHRGELTVANYSSTPLSELYILIYLLFYEFIPAHIVVESCYYHPLLR